MPSRRGHFYIYIKRKRDMFMTLLAGKIFKKISKKL